MVSDLFDQNDNTQMCSHRDSLRYILEISACVIYFNTNVFFEHVSLFNKKKKTVFFWQNIHINEITIHPYNIAHTQKNSFFC